MFKNEKWVVELSGSRVMGRRGNMIWTQKWLADEKISTLTTIGVDMTLLSSLKHKCKTPRSRPIPASIVLEDPSQNLPDNPIQASPLPWTPNPALQTEQ